VIVAAGSGGTADVVAVAARDGLRAARAQAIAESELVQAVDLGEDGGRPLLEEIERILVEGS
jgi:hypothetical protein